MSDALRLAPGSRCAVHGYARRNPFIDIRDLEQEAAVTAIEASRTWCPDGGSSREAWEAWKVGLVVSRFAAAARCPVSLPKAKRASWEVASASKAVGLSTPANDVGCDENSEADCDESPETARISVESWQPIEERLDRARALATAVELLEARHPAARAVVLDDEKPAEVAARMGLTRAEVYDHTARAMRALRVALRDR